MTLEQYLYARRFGAPPALPPSSASAPDPDPALASEHAQISPRAPVQVQRITSGPSAARSLSYRPNSPTQQRHASSPRSRSPVNRPWPAENAAVPSLSRASSGGRASQRGVSRKGFRFGEHEDDQEEGMGQNDVGPGKVVAEVGCRTGSCDLFSCFFPFLSFPFLSFPFLSFPFLSFSLFFLFFSLLSFPFLSCPVLYLPFFPFPRTS